MAKKKKSASHTPSPILSVLSPESIVRLGLFLEDTTGGELSNKNRWERICSLFDFSSDKSENIFSDLDASLVSLPMNKKCELGQSISYLRQSFIRNELDLDPSNVILHLFWMKTYETEVAFRNEVEKYQLVKTATHYYRV
jgi:hypothetical protein